MKPQWQRFWVFWGTVAVVATIAIGGLVWDRYIDDGTPSGSCISQQITEGLVVTDGNGLYIGGMGDEVACQFDEQACETDASDLVSVEGDQVYIKGMGEADVCNSREELQAAIDEKVAEATHEPKVVTTCMLDVDVTVPEDGTLWSETSRILDEKCGIGHLTGEAIASLRSVQPSIDSVPVGYQAILRSDGLTAQMLPLNASYYVGYVENLVRTSDNRESAFWAGQCYVGQSLYGPDAVIPEYSRWPMRTNVLMEYTQRFWDNGTVPVEEAMDYMVELVRTSGSICAE